MQHIYEQVRLIELLSEYVGHLQVTVKFWQIWYF